MNEYEPDSLSPHIDIAEEALEEGLLNRGLAETKWEEMRRAAVLDIQEGLHKADAYRRLAQSAEQIATLLRNGRDEVGAVSFAGRAAGLNDAALLEGDLVHAAVPHD